jgi:hypothetical protein
MLCSWCCYFRRWCVWTQCSVGRDSQAACDNMKAHVRANCRALPHAAITNAFYFSPGSKFCCAKPKPRQETEKKRYKIEVKEISNVVSGSCFPSQREHSIVERLLTSQFQHLHCNYFLSERTPKKKKRSIVFENVFEGQRPRSTIRKRRTTRGNDCQNAMTSRTLIFPQGATFVAQVSSCVLMESCSCYGSFCPCFDKKKTPWPLVRERTIPTERPPLVDEI